MESPLGPQRLPGCPACPLLPTAGCRRGPCSWSRAFSGGTTDSPQGSCSRGASLVHASRARSSAASRGKHTHFLAFLFFAPLALDPRGASAFLFGALSAPAPAAFFRFFGGGCLTLSSSSSTSSSALTRSCAHSPHFRALQRGALRTAERADRHSFAETFSLHGHSGRTQSLWSAAVLDMGNDWECPALSSTSALGFLFGLMSPRLGYYLEAALTHGTVARKDQHKREGSVPSVAGST